jgi:bacteriorhodopsin
MWSCRLQSTLFICLQEDVWYTETSLTSYLKTLDFSFKFYRISYVFIILLLGIIFNVFYQVEYEEEASYTAHFSFMCLYPLPDDGRMDNDRNML